MTVHIGAKEGQIAETILLPGDPLRAKYIAETFLEGAELYNEVRGMYGFTGTYKGKRISVQGTGMGIPSMSIYAHELINGYGVQNLIRVGTCGAYQKDIKVRDMILAMSASTDSAVNKHRFGGLDYAPTASFDLLYRAYENAKKENMPVAVGNVFTSDTFYNDTRDIITLMANYNTLAVEMEAAALYTLAAQFNRKALAILTVSDHLITGEETTSEERQLTFNQMIKVALDTAAEITN
ncbi:purine-nucleoside phosphorylase [Tumebacillus algifaecis]|uniref:Purine nucleoside phosphorylase DeoD-type n=1 Tax=Tumebacillus algifaecis TaxID=1214604 RepID=A0A223CWS0_9BACL|nr:purine-nucleoside phosphorylase [Tumebacillus algifaecis]ASS73732.1 purine-nucleoside phosphorylase [Tumebacillus algifaecis]